MTVALAPVGYLAVTGSALESLGDPVRARARTTIKPIRVVTFHDRLQVRAVFGVGHRAVCSCGWTGGKRRSVAAARFDKRCHEADHEEGKV